MLLGALIRELPDVFEVEILSKLSVKDHLALAQVNKQCRDVVYKIPPLEFMKMCTYYDDSTGVSCIYRAAAMQRVNKAVVIGRLDVLKWLWEREPSCHKYPYIEVAGYHGQKEVLDWFYTLPREDFPIKDLHRPEQFVKDLATFSEALRGAARGGHLELVKHLREKGCEWDERTCACAAQEGHVHVLEYLRTNGCPWDSFACVYVAAFGDHLDTLKWLSEHGCPWDEEVTAVAVELGYFEMLKWMREHGWCPRWDADLFAAAVSGGNLEMVTWMHENGCPWDEDATEFAAMCDKMEILKWLHENGCPISNVACSWAAENESWECLKYLVDNKCPNWEDYEDIIPESVKQKQRG